MKVTWKNEMAFEAVGNSGNRFVMDSHADYGGQNLGPTPVEALMGSIAACSAMDVISILKKKQQTVSSYEIEIQGERAPEGEWPRPFKCFTIKHILTGDDLQEAAVKRAVELSDEKYCTVMATLRVCPEMKSTFEIQ